MTDAGAHGLQHQWTAGDAPLACATEPLWGAWPSDPLRTLPVHLGTPGPWSWEAGWELEGTSLEEGGAVLTSAGEGAAGDPVLLPRRTARWPRGGHREGSLPGGVAAGRDSLC